MNEYENKKLLLSFIIPVYNCAKYLNECLDSIINQNTDNWSYEIICINDGSSDNSLQILNSYANKNTNIVVLNQNNMGVSYARNRGLSSARGEYVWFVDSDDFIRPNSLFSILEALKIKKPDELVVQPIAFQDGDDTNDLKQYQVTADASTDRYCISLWSRVLKRKIIVDNNILFDEDMSFCEDLVFLDNLKPYIKSSESLEQIVYFYRIRENSLTTSNSNTKIDKLIKNQEAFLKHIRNNDLVDKMFVSIFCGYMTVIMAYTARLPRRKEKEMLKNLKKKELFPLKKQKCFAPENNTELLGFDNRMLVRLKNESYTLLGYKKLRIFRIFLKLKRRLLNFFTK